MLSHVVCVVIYNQEKIMSSRIGSHPFERTAIKDLSRDELKEIFKRCDSVDQLYIREVCGRWKRISEETHLGQPLLDPQFMHTLESLNRLDNRISGIEQGVLKLDQDVEHVEHVQHKITDLSFAATVINLGASYILGGFLAIEAIVSQIKK